MNAGIHKGEPLASAVERIAAQEMDAALTQLRRKDRVEGIHGARKAIKKLRALLRVTKVAFPKAAFQRENRTLGAAGRKLSPVRDVHVQLRALERVEGAKDRIGRRIKRDLKCQEEHLTRRIPQLARMVSATLIRKRDDMSKWPLDQTTGGVASAGLGRAYEKGRKAFKDACKNPTSANLHEWRKQVKILTYGLEILQRLAAGKFRKTLVRCKKLGDLLGEDHDLFMILETAGRYNGFVKHSHLERGICKTRERLQKRAMKLGRKVYREKPDVFARRLSRHELAKS